MVGRTFNIIIYTIILNVPCEIHLNFYNERFELEIIVSSECLIIILLFLTVNLNRRGKGKLNECAGLQMCMDVLLMRGREEERSRGSKKREQTQTLKFRFGAGIISYIAIESAQTCQV